MAKENSDNIPVTVIRPETGWKMIDLGELIKYRDLAYNLVWRDITVQHAQTILGFIWAIITPLVQILIFSVIFGRVAKISTDGIPYTLFTTVAIIPWTYMSMVMLQSSQSLVSGHNMLGKIYFPRLLYPLTPVISKLLNFGISLLLLLAIMVYYKVSPTLQLLYLPVFILMMMLVPAGVGMLMSAMAIRYRDIKFIMTYVVQMLMYSAPIVYSATSISEHYRFFYSLNPIVGVIEGYRACLLGTEIPWQFILPGMFTAILLFIGGAFYFKRVEKIFVDVI
ncbi:MAG: ABC transporter permease [Gammaproteobacteria bacterium]|nr:ABC transporter permease [Gammaproteobacteria bacterium]